MSMETKTLEFDWELYDLTHSEETPKEHGSIRVSAVGGPEDALNRAKRKLSKMHDQFKNARWQMPMGLTWIKEALFLRLVLKIRGEEREKFEGTNEEEEE